MVRHARRTRREYRHIGAALALNAQLRALDAAADRIITDAGQGQRGGARRVAQRRHLLRAELVQRFWCGGVVAVAIDDHVALAGFPGRYPTAGAAFPPTALPPWTRGLAPACLPQDHPPGAAHGTPQTG